MVEANTQFIEESKSELIEDESIERAFSYVNEADIGSSKGAASSVRQLPGVMADAKGEIRVALCEQATEELAKI